MKEERNYYEEPEFLEEEPQEPELELTRQERRWVVLGALKAALMIGGVYIAGGALLIWLMLKIWT